MKMISKMAFGAVLALGTVFAGAEVRLAGSGATFPYPIYQKWMSAYQAKNPEVKVEYQAKGSGGGITDITKKTVDFAGSDAPLSKKEKEAVGGPVVHIPSLAGAVVLAYNVPGVDADIKLTGAIIADIYIGKIAKWNDSRIAEINAGVNLPDLAITTVARADGSGTTFVFTSYLATQSTEFKETIGASKKVTFPKGQAGNGNDGVAAIVKQTNGAIGYVEHNYATANKMPFASVQNKSGKFVKATAEGVAAAGENAIEQMKAPMDLAVNIWNQPGDNAYPISAFTYILVYQDLSYLKEDSKKKALVEFLKWAVTDGQELVKSNDYGPLSPGVQKKVLEAIDTLK